MPLVTRDVESDDVNGEKDLVCLEGKIRSCVIETRALGTTSTSSVNLKVPKRKREEKNGQFLLRVICAAD